MCKAKEIPKSIKDFCENSSEIVLNELPVKLHCTDDVMVRGKKSPHLRHCRSVAYCPVELLIF